MTSWPGWTSSDAERLSPDRVTPACYLHFRSSSGVDTAFVLHACGTRELVCAWLGRLAVFPCPDRSPADARNFRNAEKVLHGARP